jgi:hypothetical protein
MKALWENSRSWRRQPDLRPAGAKNLMQPLALSLRVIGHNPTAVAEALRAKR